MITLTRLDGRPILVNEELLLFVEKTPDTVLTFTTGLRLMVKEPVDVVADLTIAFRARIDRAHWPEPPPLDAEVLPHHPHQPPEED